MAFLLLKPDAVGASAVEKAIAAELRDEQLTVAQTFDVSLRRDDVARLWPQHRDRSCPLTGRLLELYIANRPMRLHIVDGADSIAKCVRLKRRIRYGYGANPFALPRTAVHRHDSVSDFRAKLAGLHDQPLPGRVLYQRLRYGAAGSTTWKELESCSTR